MDLIDEIFKDLIDDINKWHRKSNGDSEMENLKELKGILNEYVDSLDTDIRLQEQDKSLATIDDNMENLWI